MAPPSKKGHVCPKAATILLLQWTEILPTKGICKEAPLATRLQTICSYPFCHTKIINQEEVIEHMEMFSGTDPEHEVQSLSVRTGSNPLIYMTKLWITLEFTSRGTLATCIICLNNFNNQEELIGHINLSLWIDFECPVHRPIWPCCQQTFETNNRV